MAGIQLKVSAEVLKEKAQEVSTEIGKLQKDWQEMSRIISGSSAYWEGKASDYHRRAFQNNKNDVQAILKRLKEHPKDLQVMAGVYEQAESEATLASNNLPGNVIQ